VSRCRAGVTANSATSHEIPLRFRVLCATKYGNHWVRPAPP
jgi:hypothetical protein